MIPTPSRTPNISQLPDVQQSGQSTTLAWFAAAVFAVLVIALITRMRFHSPNGRHVGQDGQYAEARTLPTPGEPRGLAREILDLDRGEGPSGR